MSPGASSSSSRPPGLGESGGVGRERLGGQWVGLSVVLHAHPPGRPASKASGRGAVICRGPDQADLPVSLTTFRWVPDWMGHPATAPPAKQEGKRPRDADLLGCLRRRRPSTPLLPSLEYRRLCKVMVALISPDDPPISPAFLLRVRSAGIGVTWELSAEAPDHLTRRSGLRTDETTSRIACVVAAASVFVYDQVLVGGAVDDAVHAVG